MFVCVCVYCCCVHRSGHNRAKERKREDVYFYCTSTCADVGAECSSASTTLLTPVALQTRSAVLQLLLVVMTQRDGTAAAVDRIIPILPRQDRLRRSG